jgi:hypothetical protein
MIDRQILFAGLSATGKTSYLALAYQAIVQARAGAIRLGAFDDDREHVNEISAALLRAEEAERTYVEAEHELTLSLTDGINDFRLQVPDLSGETWEHALSDRRWATALDQRVRQAEGIIIFVHSTDLELGLRISTADGAFGDLAGPEAHNDAADTDHASGTEPAPGLDRTSSDDKAGEPLDVAIGDGDDAGFADVEGERKQITQVSVLDLIQLCAERVTAAPLRVAIIVSAWDLVQDDLADPTAWMDENAQMPKQFLESNADKVEATFWGVSAQGGDWQDATKRSALLTEDAIDRATVVDANGDKASVIAPIVWALGLDL